MSPILSSWESSPELVTEALPQVWADLFIKSSLLSCHLEHMWKTCLPPTKSLLASLPFPNLTHTKGSLCRPTLGNFSSQVKFSRGALVFSFFFLCYSIILLALLKFNCYKLLQGFWDPHALPINFVYATEIFLCSLENAFHLVAPALKWAHIISVATHSLRFHILWCWQCLLCTFAQCKRKGPTALPCQSIDFLISYTIRLLFLNLVRWMGFIVPHLIIDFYSISHPYFFYQVKKWLIKRKLC